MKNELSVVAQMVSIKGRQCIRTVDFNVDNSLLLLTSEGQRSTKYTGGNRVKIWMCGNCGVNIVNNKLSTTNCQHLSVFHCLRGHIFKQSVKFHSEITWYPILKWTGLITYMFYKLKSNIEGVGTSYSRLKKCNLCNLKECENGEAAVLSDLIKVCL